MSLFHASPRSENAAPFHLRKRTVAPKPRHDKPKQAYNPATQPRRGEMEALAPISESIAQLPEHLRKVIFRPRTPKPIRSVFPKPDFTELPEAAYQCRRCTFWSRTRAECQFCGKTRSDAVANRPTVFRGKERRFYVLRDKRDPSLDVPAWLERKLLNQKRKPRAEVSRCRCGLLPVALAKRVKHECPKFEHRAVESLRQKHAVMLRKPSMRSADRCQCGLLTVAMAAKMKHQCEKQFKGKPPDAT